MIQRSKIKSFLEVILLVLLVKHGECSERVLLKDVTAISLQEGRMTTGRRSSPVPQLRCSGGSAKGQVPLPKTVQCYNRGFDGSDVQWECRAELDSRVRFGNIDVSCEGYAHPDDPFVLKGSCGLRYDLEWTHSYKDGGAGSKHPYSPKATRMETIITWASIIFIAGVVLYMCCAPSNRNDNGTGGPGRDRFRSFGGGFDGGPRPPPGGGGGPGYGWNPPPPPSYDDATGYRKGPSTYSAHSSHQAPPQAGNNGGAGFWSGAAMGALGGYFMGRQNQEPRYRGSTQYRTATGFDSPSTGHSTTRDEGAGTSTQSGYGGTSRR